MTTLTASGVQARDYIDVAFAAWNALVNEIPKFRAAMKTEADVKLKIIDSVLIEVLGWEKSEIQAEESAGKGFLDYKLSVDGIARCVVEAKRADLSFELSTRECGFAYKLESPSLKSATLQQGIRQAIEYSAYKNTELACVTNGFEWLVFRSNRLGDGIDTLEGKGFVFGTHECIGSHFQLFYDLLAKERVKQLTFRGAFQEAEGRIIRHTGFQKVLRPPATAVFLQQPEVIPELDRLMTAFFQRLSNEHDKEMIEFCFVETTESRAAEQRLLRLAEELVGHIRRLDTTSGVQLADLLVDRR